MSQTSIRDLESCPALASLTESDYHRLMVVNRRRTTVTVLDELSTTIGLDDLAAKVVARESEGETTDEATIDHIGSELHHIHLPKMDRLGVIEYDPDAKRVVSQF